MPKTRNFSEREKRNAMDLLHIHDDIHAVHLLTGIQHRTLRRWRKQLLRQQTATLSEKDFSLSAKRTKSDKVQTKPQPKTNPAPIPDAAMQPPAPANAAPRQSNENNNDRDTLIHIRGQLLNFARQLADKLDPDDPDVNCQTMSLSRALDRIYWLDEKMVDGEDLENETKMPEQPNRIENTYDDPAREQPLQRGAKAEHD